MCTCLTDSLVLLLTEYGLNNKTSSVYGWLICNTRFKLPVWCISKSVIDRSSCVLSTNGMTILREKWI